MITKPSDYIVLEGESIDDLESQVKRYLADNWWPTGGIFVIKDYGQVGTGEFSPWYDACFQAMVKYPDG